MQFHLNKTVETNIDIFNKEKDFYQVWTNFCQQRIYLKNSKLKGIDPGILNEIEGPDFQGAEFELYEKIYRGDVEIHKDCADWKRHGHHLDQRYDRVVLHLVASNDFYTVYNSKNQKIPSISLLSFPVHHNNKNCLQECKLNSSNQLVFESEFQSLALQRLSIKTYEINKFISSFGIDQSLYMLILRALGNVINKNNYERLSQLIPWKLVHMLKEKNNPPEFLKALYFGAAGLINEKSDSVLNIHWKNCLPLIEGTPLKKECWRWGGIRPNNYPPNRLAGLAQLIWKLNDSSIYNVLEQLFYQRYSTAKFINKITSLFIDCVYQNQNIKNIKTISLWGRNQILELTGNVFIPFFLKIAALKKSYGFEMYLKQLYLDLPATQKYGRLKPLINNLILNNSCIKHFYFNQALLHLQNNYCAYNNFEICPLQTNKQKN